MKQNFIETLVGFVVLFIASSFFYFAYNISESGKTSDGYNIGATFQDIDGILEGSDVKIGGIKIGYVEDIVLDPDTYFAHIKFYIDNGIEIPEDSRASISTSGLLGGKYVRITPGASDDNLKPNKNIKFTQSALSIEDLIGKLVYSFTSK